jgi:hypothetical protein
MRSVYRLGGQTFADIQIGFRERVAEPRRIGRCNEFVVGEGASAGISLRETGTFRGQNLNDVNAALDKCAYDTTHVIRSANAILHVDELWELLEESWSWLLDDLKPANHNIRKSGHTRTLLIANTCPTVPRSDSCDAGLNRHTGLLLIHMYVSINQPGQKPPTLQIEDHRALRNFGSSGRDTHDPPVAHHYGGVSNRIF